MDTNPTDDLRGLQEAKHRLDDALREQFPVIVDFNRRLENLERKIERIRDLTILAIAVGLGIAFGEVVENLGSAMSWSWPAALTCGFTILAIIFAIRPYLK
jgi:hypothetical protein